ncbi:MAG TPA: P-II family nitrogen regulator [Methanoregulaceae archaeon]|nr:P-II family nitrogen regulator [Methanoregulaceae archaeon]
MKLIRAIIRPESTLRVIEALEKNGIYAMTRINVTGRGKEMGITQGTVRYSELPKEMLMIVLPDDTVPKAIKVIETTAKTGTTKYPSTGNIGDGKIFVTNVDESYTIRTGEEC